MQGKCTCCRLLLPHFQRMLLLMSRPPLLTLFACLPAGLPACPCLPRLAAPACRQFLVSQGFTNVKNVTGGIAAYSMVDRSVPEY